MPVQYRSQSVQVEMSPLSPNVAWLTDLVAKEASSSAQVRNMEIDYGYFDQLAKGKDTEVREHKGVSYVLYNGGAYKDSGFIRLKPNQVKPKAHAGKYMLVS